MSGDVANLIEDPEIQAWANELTEEDPLLGCNIKVTSFFQSFFFLLASILTLSVTITVPTNCIFNCDNELCY